MSHCNHAEEEPETTLQHRQSFELHVPAQKHISCYWPGSNHIGTFFKGFLKPFFSMFIGSNPGVPKVIISVRTQENTIWIQTCWLHSTLIIGDSFRICFENKRESLWEVYNWHPQCEIRQNKKQCETADTILKKCMINNSHLFLRLLLQLRNRVRPLISEEQSSCLPSN